MVKERTAAGLAAARPRAVSAAGGAAYARAARRHRRECPVWAPDGGADGPPLRRQPADRLEDSRRHRMPLPDGLATARERG